MKTTPGYNCKGCNHVNCNCPFYIKPTHGGRRKNAGRPQTKEPTKTIRVPVSLLPKIGQIIKKHKSKPFHGLSE